MSNTKELSYSSMYLKKFLHDIGDDRQHDLAFIKDRGESAAVEYESARHEGLTVDQAMERAHTVLMAGFL